MAQLPMLRDVLAAAARRLDSRVDAERLLMHALEVDRAWLFAHALDPVSDVDAARFDTLVARREQGEPVAYMVGRQGFWTLDLVVSTATLIPRPETECLVEQALERLPPDAPCRVADLGTGSGAIALALASERPQSRVLATDRSVDALEVARGNARQLRVANVDFVLGDWCEPLDAQRFDMIVSNPPYIEADDPHLSQGDLRFEPSGALASGRDGLDAIRTIADQAREHLVQRGWLMLEHGWQQGGQVSDLLRSLGYQSVFTFRDLEARDRVTVGQWNNDALHS